MYLCPADNRCGDVLNAFDLPTSSLQLPVSLWHDTVSGRKAVQEFVESVDKDREFLQSDWEKLNSEQPSALLGHFLLPEEFKSSYASLIPLLEKITFASVEHFWMEQLYST